MELRSLRLSYSSITSYMSPVLATEMELVFVDARAELVGMIRECRNLRQKKQKKIESLCWLILKCAASSDTSRARKFGGMLCSLVTSGHLHCNTSPPVQFRIHRCWVFDRFGEYGKHTCICTRGYISKLISANQYLTVSGKTTPPRHDPATVTPPASARRF